LILKKWDHKKGKEINIPIDVLEYLCYGVLDYVKGQGNVFNREYIIPDQIFTVELNIRNDSCKDEIVKSFKALSKFGGIGAKSRNGFGSFVIDDIEGVSFKDMQVGNLKPYTCFSKEATLLTTYSEGNWKDVLNELAEVYKKSRESIELKHNYDKRKYLGSPLIVNKVTKSFLERHSKSFIMSIGKSEEGGIKGYVLFLPYLFLEGNELYTEQHGENFDSVSLEFRGLLEEKLVKIS
jgi:CRISPR-associated protein Cmr1